MNFTTRKLVAKAWRVTMTIVFIGGSIVSFFDYIHGQPLQLQHIGIIVGGNMLYLMSLWESNHND